MYTPTKNFFVSFGISKGYQIWIFHGESLQATTSAEISVSDVQEISNEYGNIRDIFPMHNMSEPMEEGSSIRKPAQEPNKDTHKCRHPILSPTFHS